MLLDKSPEVGSLYHKVAEFLMFLENSMFFVVTAPFYMHTKTQKFQSLQILIDTCYILLFSFFISLLCSLPPFLSLPSLPSFPPSFLIFFLSYFLYIFLSFFLSFCHLNHCSVTKSSPALCNPNDCSTPGFPSLHYLLEFVQTQVH